MSVDLSELPQRITVFVGDEVEFALPSYAGSGNYWSIEIPEPSGAARVLVELQQGPESSSGPVPTAGDREPPDAAPVPESLRVTGLSPGVERCRLLLARDFGDAPPTATYDFEVVVIERR